VGRRVTEEDTGCKSRSKLVACHGCEIRKAQTTEYTQVRVFGGLGIEELVGNVILNSRTRAPIQKIGGGGECLGPVWGAHGGVNQ